MTRRDELLKAAKEFTEWGDENSQTLEIMARFVERHERTVKKQITEELKELLGLGLLRFEVKRFITKLEGEINAD